ncbi:MAG: efflux transporter outer membrane subunit [Thermodesulfobacteriota bacterium]
MKTCRSILAIFLFLALSGCAAVGPDYRPAPPAVPDKWTDQAQAVPLSPEDAAARVSWWAEFNDPVLSSLVEQAVSNNLDQKIALARIREARARAGIADAGLYPSATAQGSETKRRSSESSGGGSENELWSAGFDASWELDLFGGTRRAMEAAAADVAAAEFNHADVLVSLAAEVAKNYVNLRVYQARLDVAQRNLEIQRQTLQIAQWRSTAGLATDLDVERASYQMQSTSASLPQLSEQARQTENALALLLGQAPGTLSDFLGTTGPVPKVPDQAAEGIPAELLSRRPDIRKAERDLAAQTARIGAATADLYPKISLNGNIGLSALEAGDLFQWKNRTYGFGPSISWNVFDAGAVRSNIEVQKALAQQASLRYQQTVLSALTDVENALASFSRQQERLVHLRSAERSAATADELAAGEYASGLSDITAVLDAEQARFSLEESRVVCEGNIAQAVVGLYKAVGGGWNPDGMALKK